MLPLSYCEKESEEPGNVNRPLARKVERTVTGANPVVGLTVGSVFFLADACCATSPSAIDRGDSHSHPELFMDLLLHLIDRGETLATAAVVRYFSGKATAWSKLPRSAFALGFCLGLALGFTLTLKIVVVTISRAKLASDSFGHKLIFAADAGLLFERS